MVLSRRRCARKFASSSTSYYYGLPGRMIVSLFTHHLRTGKEFCITKFRLLLVHFSCYHILNFWWCRIRKGQRIMVPVGLINRDKFIWGEDSTEFKLVLFSISYSRLVIFKWRSLFLARSVGRIFRMLLHLSLASGQTYWHSLEVLDLVSVIDLHLWSK